ncbi:MAG: DUF523 domain-containing protein [Clostridia bacterium]|nr:DUF523 domain-containing protein [Clostridia bacterium]
MGKKEPLLISACLLGTGCRYDGKRKPLSKEVLEQLQDAYWLIPVCPEQLGGLSTPRKPAEYNGERFVCQDGTDVTEQYRKGAEESVALALLFGVKRALLKEKSPSCGYGEIYDGSFEKRLVAGNGATADALSRQGIAIFGESRIELL